MRTLKVDPTPFSLACGEPCCAFDLDERTILPHVPIQERVQRVGNLIFLFERQETLQRKTPVPQSRRKVNA